MKTVLTIFAALALGIILFVSSGVWATDSAPDEFTKPLETCFRCTGTTTGWNGYPCCSDSFAEDCAAKGGVVRFRDLHPFATALDSCYRKAPDAGLACGCASDCLARNCNLAVAIASESESCRLVSKEIVAGETDFFKSVYECANEKPGQCEESVRNGVNPGGVRETFRMEGTTLFYNRLRGPIF